MYRFKQPYYNILALFVYIDSHIALVLLNSINTLGGSQNLNMWSNNLIVDGSGC